MRVKGRMKLGMGLLKHSFGSLARFCFLILLVWGTPQSSARAEVITAFDSEIHVTIQGQLLVTERIEYDFGALDRHGIFRTIATDYSYRRHSYRTVVENIVISDEQGNDVPFTRTHSGSSEVIQIGDVSKTVTGKQVYVIKYTVSSGIHYLDRGFDEIYWNATSHSWPHQVASTSVRIYIPGVHDEHSIPRACFVGPVSIEVPCAYQPILNGMNEMIGVRVDYPTPLLAHEAITIGIGVPVGVIQKPPLFRQVFQVIRDDLLLFVFIFLPLITYGVLLISHRMVLRKRFLRRNQIFTEPVRAYGPKILTALLTMVLLVPATIQWTEGRLTLFGLTSTILSLSLLWIFLNMIFHSLAQSQDES